MSECGEQYIADIKSIEDLYTNNHNIVYQSIPSANQWIPELHLAALAKGDETVDSVKKFASADHSVNFRALINAILKSYPDSLSEFEPSYEKTLALKEKAEHLFTYEHDLLRMLHDASSVNERLWKISRHADSGYKIEIASSRQRTAMDLLSEKADYLSRPDSIRYMLDHPGHDANFVSFALKTKLTDLSPITIGTERSWLDFLSRLGIREDELLLFQALLPYIHKRQRHFWFKKSDLVKITQSLNKQYKVAKTSSAQIENLLDKLIPDLKEAADSGLAVPFVKIGEWYMFWPFAYSVLHPNLTLLAILMKRSQDHWNNTVGSQSATVATYLASQLKKSPDIEVTTCRVKKNTGDIDVAIYNKTTNTLVICEVKTVFDRFRTNHQHKNFSQQRVNYKKAAQQLIATQKEIENGNWQVNDIFPTLRPATTPKILKTVLTWWDIFDPYKGTEFSDIATSNFITFIYAFNQCDGDLQGLHHSLLELAALPCPAMRIFNAIDEQEFQLKWSIDKQTDCLPPDNDPRCMVLSGLSKQLLSEIKRFPENWKQQMVERKEDPNCVVFP